MYRVVSKSVCMNSIAVLKIEISVVNDAQKKSIHIFISFIETSVS
jgi:hypothetical protein